MLDSPVKLSSGGFSAPASAPVPTAATQQEHNQSETITGHIRKKVGFGRISKSSMMTFSLTQQNELLYSFARVDLTGIEVAVGV